MFDRFSYTPQSPGARYSSDLAQVIDTANNNKTLTLGSTNMLSSRLTNEARYYMSWNDQLSTSFIDTFGGATPLQITDLNALTSNDWALFAYRPSVTAGFWQSADGATEPVQRGRPLTYTMGRHAISAGLRWDVNSAPRDANGNQPYTADQITDLATTRIAPNGSELWSTNNNFAPRFGPAYHANSTAGHETTIRAGAGLFYDASNVQASEGYWYGIGITGTLNMAYKPFPVDAATLASTPLPSTTITAERASCQSSLRT